MEKKDQTGKLFVKEVAAKIKDKKYLRDVANHIPKFDWDSITKKVEQNMPDFDSLKIPRKRSAIAKENMDTHNTNNYRPQRPYKPRYAGRNTANYHVKEYSQNLVKDG